MPIRIADSAVSPDDLQNVAEQYIIFFSSYVDGELWCPDCRAVESLVKEVFSGEELEPSAVLVYVGNRPEWKTPTNVFRGEPWKVQSVPTIIKLKDGKEVARLEDDEFGHELKDLVSEV